MTQQHSGAAFDPDSSAEQPAGALEALIAQIEAEIIELQFPRFTRDDALNLGLLLVELGKDGNMPIAIDITKGEQVLFHVALEGATPDNEHWVKAKQRTAARYEEPSLLVGLRGRVGGGRIEDNAWFDQSICRPRRFLPRICGGRGRGGHGDGLGPAAEGRPRSGSAGLAGNPRVHATRLGEVLYSSLKEFRNEFFHQAAWHGH
jgi:hypothetical protein